MKRKPKITLVKGDDWAGLYVDGELFTEGHSVSLKDLADAAGIELERIDSEDYFDGCERSSCPSCLDEVKDFLKRADR